MVRRSILVFMMCFWFMHFTNAQIQKGTITVGAHLAGMNFDIQRTGGINISLSPKVAWFVQQNLSLGGYANLGFSKRYEVANEWTYQAGVVGRYYMLPKKEGGLSGRTGLFLEGNVGYDGYYVAGLSTSGINVGIGPGLAYFIRDNISLEGIVKYDGNFRFNNQNSVSKILLGIGFQIYFFRNSNKQ